MKLPEMLPPSLPLVPNVTDAPDDNLAQLVQAWINRTGHPLEYRVADQLEGHGFEVAQGRAYLDHRADTLREVDVIATIPGDSLFRVSLVVECKYTEKPWVVLSSRTAAPAAEIFGATIASRTVADTVEERMVARAEAEIPFFNQGVPGIGVAMSLRDPSAAKDDRDPAFDTLRQVVSAAQGIVAARQYSWTLAWPVIVLAGRLFVAAPDGEGGLAVREVGAKRLLWHGATTDRPVAVDIVTEAKLGNFATMAHGGLSAVLRELEAAHAEVLARR